MKTTPQQVDLLHALILLASEPGGRYGEYVAWFAEQFACSERAAKDALGVLKAAGYTDAREDEADRRYRRYWPTARAEHLLEHPRAGTVLRYARRLFSACRVPSPVSAAERRDRLERCENLLTGIGPLDLSGDFSLCEIPTSHDLPLPKVETDPLAEPLQIFRSDSRCKVCRSPYRAEIDLRIARGQTQAAVRRQINEQIGSDHFTANNISRHLRQHFSEHTPELREALHNRVLHQQQQRQATIAYLDEIILTGFAAIHTGVTQVSARQLIRAVEYREARRSTNSDWQQKYAEMISDFGLFMKAAREVLGDAAYEDALAAYAHRSATAKRYRDYEARRRLIEPGFSFT